MGNFLLARRIVLRRCRGQTRTKSCFAARSPVKLQTGKTANCKNCKLQHCKTANCKLQNCKARNVVVCWGGILPSGVGSEFERSCGRRAAGFRKARALQRQSKRETKTGGVEPRLLISTREGRGAGALRKAEVVRHGGMVEPRGTQEDGPSGIEWAEFLRRRLSVKSGTFLLAKRGADQGPGESGFLMTACLLIFSSFAKPVQLLEHRPSGNPHWTRRMGSIRRPELGEKLANVSASIGLWRGNGFGRDRFLFTRRIFSI